jgi:tyrosyl-tRNA synthetase
MTLFQELKRRGLIAQTSHESEIETLLNKGSVKFYTGFDATADSLHIGGLLQLVTMRRFQLAGHYPIALLGTATSLIGDPTGKTDMRKMLTAEEVADNAARFIVQMEKFLDFSDGKAETVKNGDWFGDIKYLDFLGEIGRHFSVNKMLTAECFKSRFEGKGLSFLEFNYMLLQSYDFLHLFRTKGVTLQLGGDDQWSNILAGADLVRRAERGEAYAMTFTLITTSDGRKMGKTEKGALWLDPKKCAPYDFYQYFRNVDDADVINLLKWLSFVPIEDIERMEREMKGSALNDAKELLAFELTKMVHSEEEAVGCRDAARSVFGGGVSDGMPTTEVEDGEVNIVELLLLTGLAPSQSEGRRLIAQGGVSVNDKKIDSPDEIIAIGDAAIIKKGKKAYHRAVNKHAVNKHKE